MYNAAIHMHTCIDACTDIFASLECLLNAFKFTEPQLILVCSPDVLKPKAGETLVVNAAAGAVGSVNLKALSKHSKEAKISVHASMQVCM